MAENSGCASHDPPLRLAARSVVVIGCRGFPPAAILDADWSPARCSLIPKWFEGIVGYLTYWYCRTKNSHICTGTGHELWYLEYLVGYYRYWWLYDPPKTLYFILYVSVSSLCTYAGAFKGAPRGRKLAITPYPIRTGNRAAPEFVYLPQGSFLQIRLIKWRIFLGMYLENVVVIWVVFQIKMWN